MDQRPDIKDQETGKSMIEYDMSQCRKGRANETLRRTLNFLRYFSLSQL